MSPPAPALWNNRFYAALGVAPLWIGLALAATFVALLLISVQWSGELARFVEADTRWWQDRNARVALVVVLLAAYLPTARRYEWLEASRDFAALRASGLAGRGVEASAEPLRAAAAGALALPIVPLLALMVDRDVSLYLRRDYWVGSNLFIWLIGAFATWHWGILLRSVWSHATLLSRAARDIPQLSLLRLDGLEPFSRYGLRCALLWSLLPGIWALNLVDRGFFASVGSMAAIAAMGASLALLLPLRGVRDRIRAEKQTELGRIDAAIAGNPGALHSSALRHWNGALSLADLLAYRSRVEEIREWPLGRPTFARFALYLLIPVGSWLGGAFVERIVDAFLD